MFWLRIVGLCLVIGCARIAPPLATMGDAQRARVTLSALHEGRALLISKCGGCHQTPMPYQYSAVEWPQKLGEMSERASLDAAQIGVLEKYLVTMSDQPRTAALR